MRAARFGTVSLAGFLVLVLFFNGKTGLQSTCDSPVVGGHTGAPGETSCAGCHPGVENSGPASLEFDLGTTTYVPNQIYTGKVKMKQAGLTKFGFSALALKSSTNTTIGTFAISDVLRLRTYADGARKYVGHTPCGADAADSTQWEFTWQAPATNVGNIVLYMGALAANHNHSTSGDFTYKKSIILSPENPTAIARPIHANSAFKVFPTVATNHIEVEFSQSENEDLKSIRLVNQLGKNVLYKAIDNGNKDNSMRLDIQTIPAGAYYVWMETNKRSYAQKIIKQ